MPRHILSRSVSAESREGAQHDRILHLDYATVQIFVDCLVVLDIISKWGRYHFHPSPMEVVHFALICPLLQELHPWLGKVTLVKVKSHTGCLLKERADELAELGRQTENPEICPGPQKYGSFWLRTRPVVREYAEFSKSLPRDSAPNRSLLEAVVAFNTLRRHQETQHYVRYRSLTPQRRSCFLQNHSAL
jgi:hypothetical protein